MNVLKTIWSGWFLDNYKTYIAAALLAATKFLGVPELDITNGLSLDELLVLWTAIDNKLKNLGLRK